VKKMAAPGKNLFEYHTIKSVVAVVRPFREKYVNYPPADKTIRA
jgi:hypothetical protein